MEALPIPAEKAGGTFSVTFRGLINFLHFTASTRNCTTQRTSMQKKNYIKISEELSNCPHAQSKDPDPSKPTWLGPCLVGVAQGTLEKVYDSEEGIGGFVIRTMTLLHLVRCWFPRSRPGKQQVRKSERQKFPSDKPVVHFASSNFKSCLLLCSSPSLPVLCCSPTHWVQIWYTGIKLVLWSKSTRSARSKALLLRVSITMEI